MFCIQCEQTIQTPAVKGCSFAQGMCGKTAEVSDLQDLLVHALQALSIYANRARSAGVIDQEIDQYAARAFFSTLTNVNFDSDRIVAYTNLAQQYRDQLKAKYIAACTAAGKTPDAETAASEFTLADNDEALTAQIDAELEELIPGYLHNRQQEIPTLFQALEQRDFEALRQAGHALKGSGYGKALEDAANAQSLQKIESTLQQLKDYVFHVRVEYV